MHPGIDIAAKKNTPVYAPGDGVIEKASYTTGGYGNLVTIDHGFGYRTKYGHLNSMVVTKGQNIKRGELIGYVGTTGTSTSDHLHYEVLKDNRLMNPLNYFFDDIDQEEYEQILELALAKSPD
jgi:murein DD-endopeptidase MepM/ murein hydrolase activator NlpD